MALNDPIADSLSKINNAVKALYKEVELKKSKFLLSVLEVLKENGYVGSYEVIEDGKQGIVKVTLLGTINKCGIINQDTQLKLMIWNLLKRDFYQLKTLEC